MRLGGGEEWLGVGADWDLDWLGLLDAGSNRFSQFETKELEREREGSEVGWELGSK